MKVAKVFDTMAAGMASMASSMIDAAFYAYNDASAPTDPLHVQLDHEKPVWILGKLFRADEDLEALKEDILSRLWFTYRRNFPSIGDFGPTCDTGWGCMLRCGQMMLGQALLYYHLGRDWSWSENKVDDTYVSILRSFLDTWDGEYSIHNIALTGVGEGKQVGEWFGPNTVSQVLRKLVLFDDSSSVFVHVAMDNTVVIDDIKTLCKSDRNTWVGFANEEVVDDEPIILEDESMQEDPLAVDGTSESVVCDDVASSDANGGGDSATTDRMNISQDENPQDDPNSLAPSDPLDPSPIPPSSPQSSTSPSSTPSAPSDDNTLPDTSQDAVSSPLETTCTTEEPSQIDAESKTPSEEDCLCTNDAPAADSSTSSETAEATTSSSWHPLVFFIPLRLGLMEINSDYYSSLKAMFTLKQSLGVIGGKPNHAHYFIGFNGDKLLYLDPHTTQDNVEPQAGHHIPDDTYHCMTPNLMDFSSLDPSLALGFYCETEEAFDEWTVAMKELVTQRDQRPMFEICEHRPKHWPPFELPRKPMMGGAGGNDSMTAISECDETATYDYGEEDQIFDSSGEYEII